MERIQKILATAGFGSRRACEALVEAGRVSVNGRRVRALPVLVDPEKDRIRVDGKPVRPERLVYFLLNKPPGYYCTNRDPAGRRRAIDLMTGVRERVFPVGRLDAGSSGLLLMTNDGALAEGLTHPRYGVPKTYRVETRGRPSADDLARLRKGVWLSEGRTGPAEVTLIHKSREKTILEITLREGRNREVRRMLARLGHRVRRLTRIRMGRLSIRKLPLGEYRPLTESEVVYLKRLAAAGDAPARPTSARPRPRRATANRPAAPRGRRSPPPKRPAAAREGTARAAKKASTKSGPRARKRRIILPPGE